MAQFSIADPKTFPKMDLLNKSLAEDSLEQFIEQAWHIVEPASPFMSNWHIGLISEYLELVSSGEIKRLIINIPPKYLKSRIVSVMWPAWSWINNPALKFIFCSHAQDLCIRDSRYRRQIFQSEWFTSIWKGLVEFAPDQNAKTEFENIKTGSMICKSVGASAIGRGSDFIVIDDPLNPGDAYSDVKRKEANRWVDQTISTRLDNKAKGGIVLIMQRVHDKDVTGYLLDKKTVAGDQRWTHLVLPATAEKKTWIIFPKSEKEFLREKGSPLFEEREDLNILKQQEIDMGSYSYSGQFQQRPSPEHGGIIKTSWWRYYNPEDINLSSFDTLIQSWDMSFKDLESSSYVVGQVWGKLGARRYLLDQVRVKADFVKTVLLLRTMSAKWENTVAKLVEDKANGTAIISTLSSEIPGIIPVNPQGSKIARLAAISPYIEAGNVYLPSATYEPWITDFVLEHEQFPNAANDDQVDAASQALKYLRTSSMSEQMDAPIFGAPRISMSQGIGSSQMNPW